MSENRTLKTKLQYNSGNFRLENTFVLETGNCRAVTAFRDESKNMEQTVIYEITAVIALELVEEYEDYMRHQHIPDLLETGHFRAAFLIRSGEQPRSFR
jgi:hypothetical protein